MRTLAILPAAIHIVRRWTDRFVIWSSVFWLCRYHCHNTAALRVIPLHTCVTKVSAFIWSSVFRVCRRHWYNSAASRVILLRKSCFFMIRLVSFLSPSLPHQRGITCHPTSHIPAFLWSAVIRLHRHYGHNCVASRVIPLPFSWFFMIRCVSHSLPSSSL